MTVCKPDLRMLVLPVTPVSLAQGCQPPCVVRYRLWRPRPELKGYSVLYISKYKDKAASQLLIDGLLAELFVSHCPSVILLLL